MILLQTLLLFSERRVFFEGWILKVAMLKYTDERLAVETVVNVLR